VLVFGGVTSAQVIVVPAGPPPVVAVPAPPVAVVGGIATPGGVVAAPAPAIVVAPVVPVIRPAYYPVYPRPVFFAPYHHHRW